MVRAGRAASSSSTSASAAASAARSSAPHRLFRSRFHEIVDDERIIFAYDLEHDHRLISVSLTTIEFFAAGDGGTRLRFTEQGAFFDGPHAAAEREHGTGELLDAFERFLAGEPVR